METYILPPDHLSRYCEGDGNVYTFGFDRKDFFRRWSFKIGVYGTGFGDGDGSGYGDDNGDGCGIGGGSGSGFGLPSGNGPVVLPGD